MPPSHILKYLLDIESVISELELIIQLHENDYLKFEANFMAIRSAERDLMIIGEAINKIQKLDPNIKISNTKHSNIAKCTEAIGANFCIGRWYLDLNVFRWAWLFFPFWCRK